MLNDTLRFWALLTQALGLTLIIFLETWLGRGQAGDWQLWVLAFMLLSALLLAVLRHYRNQRQLKARMQRWQQLQDQEAQEEKVQEEKH